MYRCNTMQQWVNLEAHVKGVGIQNFDRVHRHGERLTRGQPGLNLNVDKVNCSLGSLDRNWAVFSKDGQDFS